MWCLREMHLPMQQQLGQEKANFTGKHLCWSRPMPATLLKSKSSWGVSYEICEIFKNTY